MLFPGELLLSKALMVLMLALSSILAIAINSSDLSGHRKKKMFSILNSSNLVLYIPGCLFIAIAQVVGLIKTEYITLQNSTGRVALLLGSVLVLAIAVSRVLPLSQKGLEQVRRRSANSSKYAELFAKLRTSHIAIVIFIIFAFWLSFMFGGL
jgi:hypothetical protein